MCRTQISLPEAMLAYVRRLARKRRVSMSALIRSLIEEMISNPGAAEEDPFFELGTDPRHGGPKDGSVEHDRYLYERRRQ
jgi:hypothetical protein